MKQYKILLLLLLVPFCGMHAQSETGSLSYLSANAVHEQVQIITERNCYLSGEKILFTAFYTNDIADKNIVWSTVLYVELIGPKGEALHQAKVPLKNEKAYAEIEIPESIPSGTYYMKAYTRWMRNYPVNTYAFRKLKIVNPTNRDVQQIQDQNRKNIRPASSASAMRSDMLDISLSEGKAAKRRTMDVEVKVNTRQSHNLRFTAVVVKDELHRILSEPVPLASPKPEYDTAVFLPELRGTSLSGILRDGGGKPVAGAEVQLAMLNHHNMLSGYISKDDGSFYFTFPETGHNYELFLTASQSESQGLNFSIEDEFCTKAVSLPVEPFELDSLEKISYNELYKNKQLQQAFSLKDTTESAESDSVSLSFYGSPSFVYYTKDYIELPNMAEFLFELVPEVTVKYKKKVPTARIAKNHPFAPYKLLYLIDNVPVKDETAFLRFQMKHVERVEIIDNGYITGDLRYGGVISAFTYNNDMGGFDLPDDVVFLNYVGLGSGEFAAARCKAEESKRIPDRRSGLYINPGLSCDSDGKLNFSFTTSDVSGTYRVIVYGHSPQTGELLFNESTFEVE